MHMAYAYGCAIIHGVYYIPMVELVLVIRMNISCSSNANEVYDSDDDSEDLAIADQHLHEIDA